VPGTVSVLIAYPKTMAAKLLAEALSRQSRFRVVALVTSANELFDAMAANVADVALVSARMAEGPVSGFDVLRRIRERAPNLKVVMLFESREQQLVVDAFRMGAKGVFCTYQSEFELLCECVDRVHGGQIWANSEELNWVISALEATSSYSAPLRVLNAEGVNLLSKREEDVVKLLMEGLPNREIARHLDLSEHTIKNYFFRIFDKLGVSSRTELLLYAMSSARRAPALPASVEQPVEASR
jgi:two-component system nitrate/nitrite response regulator NarL